MLHSAASDQDLHCLPLTQHFLDISACTHSYMNQFKLWYSPITIVLDWGGLIVSKWHCLSLSKWLSLFINSTLIVITADSRCHCFRITAYLKVKIWSLPKHENLTTGKKYCGKEEKLLLRSNFSSFPQYFQYISYFMSEITLYIY